MKLSATLLILCIVFSQFAWSAEVTQVKGTKALVNLSGTSAQVGQEFFIVSSTGKKIAIVVVRQAKGGKALVEVLKGRAEVGGSLTPRSGAAPQQQATQNSQQPQSADQANASEQKEEAKSEESTETTTHTTKKKRNMGILFGLGMNSFAMDIGPVGTTLRDSGKLSGTSMSLKLFGDYDLSQKLTLRFAGGYEPFAAKGSIPDSFCTGGTTRDGNPSDCSVSFTYLSLEGSAHYNYSTGKSRGWIGLGYSFLLQMGSSNNIPNLVTSGGTNQMILISTGYDVGLAKGRFIPMVLEYGIFPGSADVKASAIYARIGYGFPF